VLEAIPTPGHCPGSTCYLLQQAGKQILFTGDTIYPDNGEWKIYLHGNKSSGKDMLASLDLLAGLSIDIILPGLYIGDVSWEAVSPARWTSVIDGCMKQVIA